MNDSTFYDYVERKRQGEDFTSIRESMKADGFSSEEISKAIREIDEEILNDSFKTQSNYNPRFIVGIVMFTIGMILLLLGFFSVSLFGMLPIVFMFAGLLFIVARRQVKGGRIERNKWHRR